MQDIENLAMQTYSKNIEYIKKNHKELITLLTTLDLAISKGDYIPRYDLEYINDYLYNKDSLNTSKQMAKLVNFKKNFLAFEGFPIYSFNDDQLDKTDTVSRLITSILPLMRYYRANSEMVDEMKEIKKFIFVGVRLGLHIPIIHEKIRAEEYLIIEDDLEIFKLSLFTTEYYKLAQDATLYFSVADDENLFVNTTKIYLHNTFFENRYLKYLKFPHYPNHKLKQLQNAITTQSFIFFPYKISLDKFIKPLEYINDGYNILNLSHNFRNSTVSDKPVLVLGAGPSFKKNIKWLEKNHNKFIIIAATATLKTLYPLGIKPDIITHLDGQALSHEHYDGIDTHTYLKDTIVLLGGHVSEFVRTKFEKSNIFYYEEKTFYFKNFSSLSTPCVGSFSLLLALQMQSKNTYTLGLDFSVDQETGATHSSDHVEATLLDMSEKEELSKTMDYRNNLFEVKGNFRDIVFTNGLLHASVQVLFNTIPRIISKQQRIYNLADGAAIPSASALKIETITVDKFEDLDKSTIFNVNKELFLSHSKLELDMQDIYSMKKRLNNALEIKNLILQFNNKPTSSQATTFMYDLLGLVSVILKKSDRESDNLTQVFFEYFQYSLAVTVDLLNTKGLKNEKRHIKKLNKLLVDEMSSICDIYINELEKFITNRC
ncbi:hypothetical protein MNB_SM-4-458 [hydrothermal vent metagenome]|uniref:Motility accessory factor n=1 Tax=hydrothermal vent metagenome TaxID=652676 RepID=A0A1W1BBL9_9ZZZZ